MYFFFKEKPKTGPGQKFVYGKSAGEDDDDDEKRGWKIWGRRGWAQFAVNGLTRMQGPSYHCGDFGCLCLLLYCCCQKGSFLFCSVQLVFVKRQRDEGWVGDYGKRLTVRVGSCIHVWVVGKVQVRPSLCYCRSNSDLIRCAIEGPNQTFKNLIYWRSKDENYEKSLLYFQISANRPTLSMISRDFVRKSRGSE